MTTSKALTWAEGLAKQIPSFIEPGASAQQIAFQTKFWEKEIKVAQRLAMKNSDDVLALNTVDPIITIWIEQQKLAKTMAGDAMWKQISKDAINNIFRARKKLTAYKEKLAKAQEACFIAGTLVHTDKGLVPIEKLQVGDMVLSQPENKGTLSYKPITRTFVHEEQEVMVVKFSKLFGPKPPPGTVVHDLFVEWIGATPNHPFYSLADGYNLKLDGWYPAKELDCCGEVELKDGSYAGVGMARPLFATGQSDQGWFPWELRKGWYDTATLMDLSGETMTCVHHDYSAPGHREDVPLLKRTVYNIEVQDNHTYYVGQLGLWVHNKNPNDTSTTVVLSEAQAVALDGNRIGRTFYKKEPLGNDTAGLFEQQTPGMRMLNNIFGARKKLTAYKDKLAKAQEACFIAGTLVHTDKGLVPIEKLQVGDMVLSQPENKGPLSYKPITRTFVHEEQEVLAIHFTKIFDADTLPPGGVSRNYFSEWIVATPNHPFYTLANEYQFSTDGWYPASQFVSGRVELKDGTHAGASWAKPLFATGTPDQAWFALEPRRDWYGAGRLLDLSTGTVTATRHYNAPGHREDVPLLKRTVYNIEVQDNHTYYVGQLGMWVHNKNPNDT